MNVGDEKLYQRFEANARSARTRRALSADETRRERWSVAVMVLIACASIFGLMALIARHVLQSRSLLVVLLLAAVGCSSAQLASLHSASLRAQGAVDTIKANGPATVAALEASVAAVASQTGPLHAAALRAQAVIAAYKRNEATILDVELAVSAVAGVTANMTKPVGP